MSYSDALEQQVALIRWADAGFPELSGEIKSMTRHLIRATLVEGHSVYVAQHIAELIRHAARSYPNVPLVQQALPLTNGFVYFARPLDILPPLSWREGFSGVVAASWMQIESSGDMHPGAFVTFWSMLQGTSRLWPTSVLHWDYGSGWDDFKPRVAGDERLPEVREYMRSLRRLLGTLWEFMQQRILVATHVQAERHARKRVEQMGWTREPLIRVIELRRRERIGKHEPVAPVEREWSCQWIVRGHWRQQFYPSRHANVPIWITPYVKGPDDKPLRPPRATVFAVVR